MVRQKMAQSSLRHNWFNRFPLLRSETQSAVYRNSGINSFTHAGETLHLSRFPLSRTRGSQRRHIYFKRMTSAIVPDGLA